MDKTYNSILILLVFIFAYLTTNCLCQEEEDEQYRVIDVSYKYVMKECDNQLRKLDSLDKFSQFMYHYKFLVKYYKKPKKSLINGENHLKHCYEEKEPIFELEKLINSRHEGICRTSYIDKILDYHSKYIAKDYHEYVDSNNGDNNNETIDSLKKQKSSYISFFFSVYANQVAYTCKSRIIDKIKLAQSKQDCSIVLAKALPQIFASKSNTTKEEETVDKNINQNLEDLNDLIDSFDRIENFVPVIKSKKIKLPQGFYDVVLPNEAVEKIDDLKGECNLREPLYTALFTPVAALAALGYTIDGDSDYNSSSILNADGNDKKLLKCWLATAQLCQGILRTNLTINNEKEIDAELKSKLVTIRWGSNNSNFSNETTTTTTTNDDIGIDLSESLDEISPFVLTQVEKRFTLTGKIKSKLLSKLKKFAENRLDLEAIQEDAEKKFIDSLTDVDNGIDSKIAFAGKKYDEKQYNPASKIINHADTAVKMSSSFWGKHIGLIFSSIVAIVLSGVFVWFSLYALASVVKQHYQSPNDDRNFKQSYLELREKQLNKMKAKKTGIFKFYNPSG